MKKALVWLLCLLMPLSASAGLAEEAGVAAIVSPGAYAHTVEMAALDAGLALQRDVTFAWGGLPLLEADENQVIKALLGALSFRRQEQGMDGDGYLALDMLLKDVSVLDITQQTRGGVYYESSNLLGGQTVAFTEASFSQFMARLSARSSSLLPTNLDVLFSALVQALGTAEAVTIDAQTLRDAFAMMDAWSDDALVEVEQLRPRLYIPGLYGTRALVIDITREEAIAFAEGYVALLADNEALWLDAARAQAPAADTIVLGERAQQAAEQLRALPELLADWLPTDMPPMEYREVLDAGGKVVARQIEATLPGNEYIFAEWTPDMTGLYLALSVDDLAVTALVTRELGEPAAIGSLTRLRNRTIAEISAAYVDVYLNATITRSENIETRDGKESVLVKQDCQVECPALFGEGAIVTLTIQATDTASGVAEAYTRKQDTIWRVKGLGFDRRDLLTVSTRTKAQAAQPPAIPEDAVLYPAEMDDAALDAWLQEISQVYTVQAWYTILGRLPAEVARYALTLMQP